MLARARVLVVEDDFLIAVALAHEVEAVGATVIGPYASVAVTLRVLQTETVDGAILDANLADRDVTPVVLMLVKRKVPIVIHSGVGIPAALSILAADLRLIMKPAEPARVVAALAQRL